MTIARRLLCAGGALMIAAMFGRCDSNPETPPNPMPDLSMPMVNAPTLTMIAPASALNTGGTTITLTGTNFRAGATVTINGTAATQVTVVSPTQITCSVPAKAATCGPATVVVMNSDGTMASNMNLFKYRSMMLGFANSVSVGVGTRPRQVTVADIDGDGKLDLLTANSTSGDVSVALGMGNGSFATATNTNVGGNSPFALATADLNGDQKLDLITVHRTSSEIKVRINNSTTGNVMLTAFTPTATLSVGANPEDLAVGNLNGDGNLDVIVSNTGSNNLSVLTGKGGGDFNTATTVALTGTAPQTVILAQWNAADQNLDLATANTTGTSLVTTRLGMGNGTFSGTAGTVSGSLTGPTDLVAGDFNGDGVLDLAVANGGVGTVRIGVGNGDGSFTGAFSVNVGTTAATFRSIATGDFNLDGFLDLAVTNAADGTVSVLIADGLGNFLAKTDYNVGTNPTNITIADLNKDGLPDFVVNNDVNGGSGAAVVRMNMCQ